MVVPFMRPRLPLLVFLAAALALCAVVPALAVRPRANAKYEAHDHRTKGKNWHVEMEVNRGRDRLKTLILYVQECDETQLAENVAVRPDGSFRISRPLEGGAKGTWTVEGTFPSAGHAHGTYALEKRGCAVGPKTFDAHDAAGDGHGNHAHGGHIMVGNMAEYPSWKGVPAATVRKARRLRMRTVRASRRFDTVREAKKARYKFNPRVQAKIGCPGMHHMRKRGTSFWGKVLDPKAPQSLVFWCTSRGKYKLAAYMYRAPGEKRPPTFGDTLQWHKHGTKGDWMAHVWIVPNTRSALATCAPFNSFKKYGRFAFEPFRKDVNVDRPCSDTVGA
jgi:hypothetical protein